MGLFTNEDIDDLEKEEIIDQLEIKMQKVLKLSLKK